MEDSKNSYIMQCILACELFVARPRLGHRAGNPGAPCVFGSTFCHCW